MTTTLDPGAGHVVLINTFTVDPARAAIAQSFDPIYYDLRETHAPGRPS